jgi:hypothetical protein
MSGRERTVDTQHQPAYSGKHFMKSRVPKEVRQWASRNGKKGGHTITKRKSQASSENLAKARQKRWPYRAHKKQPA